MNELQEIIGKWGEDTFPEATLDGIIAHLKKEVSELAERHDPQESADCLILLFHHAYLAGYDLLAEAQKKLQINKKRKWGTPDKHGVIEHIKE